MSFIGDLFGGGDKQSTPAPQPTSAAPTISNAASQSAALEENARQKNKLGTDKTILTGGLGDTSSGANVNRTSALGGNSSLT